MDAKVEQPTPQTHEAGAWRALSRPPARAPGEMHIWRISLLGDESANVLDARETERVHRFTDADGRRRFIAARATLRRLLGHYGERPPETLRFRYSALGKPALDPPAPLHFSLAHCGDVALLAVADTAVGVDVELIRPVARTERILERLFAEATAARVLAVQGAAREQLFAAAWTQREAFVKAIGGSVMTAKDVLPLVAEQGVTRLSAEGETWTVVRLQPAAQHAGCAVAEGAVQRVVLLDWTP